MHSAYRYIHIVNGQIAEYNATLFRYADRIIVCFVCWFKCVVPVAQTSLLVIFFDCLVPLHLTTISIECSRLFDRFQFVAD